MNRFQEIFLDSLKGRLADLLDLRGEAVISFHMDQSPVQDSFRYRAKYLGLKFANLLIDEKGELKREVLDELNRLLNEGSFILGPGREGDALIFGHIKRCLRELAEHREVGIAIRRFSPPLCHKKADEVIRETLWPEPIRAVQTVHVRKAVIAAWLTFLRQTTGSCFATAPAILIQQNNPIQFFKDMYDLLSTGQLKRTMGGKEYSVPLSLSSGMGDLQKIGGVSPGVSVALDSVGIKMVPEKVRGLGSQTVEMMLRMLTMEHAGLTEEDIQDEEHLSQIQMTLLLAKQTAVYYQKPTERGQKVAEWKKNFARACTTFKTFTECALLRTWEYSIASFSDVKTEFARWNLYIGLGLHPDQKEGIGEFLYGLVNQHLQRCNAEIERVSKEYEQIVIAMDGLDGMMRSSVSDVRRNQLKSEWTFHSLSLNTLVEMRNQLIAKGESLVGFFSFLIEQYDQKLQESFQELFDPGLIGEEAHLYDDSFAGFRLVYKHGRLDASQWTPIYSGEQYVDSLRDFFSNVENEIVSPPHIGKEMISEITTGLMQFVQQPEFLSSAIKRSKEKGRKSPWDYISGGTLQTLLMAYCSRDRGFKESALIPHSEEELIHFLSNRKNGGPLLMHSPTHAFIFYPDLLSTQTANKKNVQWNEAMQEHIAHRVSERLPSEEKALFLHLFRQKNPAETRIQFRTHLIDSLGAHIKQKEAIVDSVLYESFPLLSLPQAKEALQQILRSLGKNEIIRPLEGTYFGPFDLYQWVKMNLLQFFRKGVASIDWDQKIAESMRYLDLSPNAWMFADTNWSGWFFGFVINPATDRLELWRLNRTAIQGFPMIDWKQWLDAQNTHSWILLSDPKEYAL